MPLQWGAAIGRAPPPPSWIHCKGIFSLLASYSGLLGPLWVESWGPVRGIWGRRFAHPWSLMCETLTLMWELEKFGKLVCFTVKKNLLSPKFKKYPGQFLQTKSTLQFSLLIFFVRSSFFRNLAWLRLQRPIFSAKFTARRAESEFDIFGPIFWKKYGFQQAGHKFWSFSWKK